MAGPFDATLKHLLEKYARDWLSLLEISVSGEVHVVDANLATVSAEADKLLRIEQPAPWLVHLELQSSHAPDLPDRTLLYNVLAGHRHQCSVESVILLLRPQADGPALTGELDRHTPLGRNHQFHYRLVRVWELPVERLLQNGVGTLPLAPLVAEPGDLPRILDVMRTRLGMEVDPPESASLWTASYVLMGLRYKRDIVSTLMKRVRSMEDSDTYQAILEKGEERGVTKGRIEAARDVLVLVATDLMGSPNEAQLSTVESISEYERLRELTRRAAHVSSWDELLAIQRQ